MIMEIKCNYGKEIIMEHTTYKEKGREAMVRLNNKYKFTNKICTEIHYFGNQIEMHNGLTTTQKTKIYGDCLAFARESINKRDLPNKKWRIHIEKETTRC